MTKENLFSLLMIQIFFKAETELLAYKNANEILKKVDLYMKANKLHINMDKCCFMHFNPDTKENFDYDGCHLKIGDEIIEKVTNTKFLGIFIDENLSWDVHINYLVKKLACTTGILNRVKENIPTELHKNLYHTLFESHLTYGITSWGGVCDNKLKHSLTLRRSASEFFSETKMHILINLKLVAE